MKNLTLNQNTKNEVKSIGAVFAPLLLVATLLLLNSNMVKADSNADLRDCINKTYQAAIQAPSSAKASDVLKFVSKDIKACKDQVKSLVKAEKAAKKRTKLEAQLKKLQAKLGNLN